MEEQLNIGIIGCGKIAESNHLPALLNIPGVRVDWLYDINEGRSKLLSQMYQLPVVTSHEMEKRLPVTDICLLTIPYGVRTPYINMCAAAGTALYVEKPFATTLAGHLQYCELFPPHQLAIGFQRRYYHTQHMVASFIQQKKFGNLQSVFFNQGYFQLKGGSGFLSDARISGGGVIIESAIHTLDQILQFTDAMDIAVNSIQSVFKNGIDYDTQFSSTLTTPGNTVEVHCNISTLRNLDNGIELVFDNGRLHFMPSAAANIMATDAQHNSFRINDTTMLPSESQYATTVSASFMMFWKDFIDAVKHKTPNKTSAASSLLTTKWIEGIYSLLKK